jgi:toxin ParE1/3/4
VPDKPLEVRWLKRALASLEAEAEYIARGRPAAARRMVATIERSVELLAHHPALSGPGRVEGTRELVVPSTPYIIPYRVRGAWVEILRVFHGARKWPPKFQAEST